MDGRSVYVVDHRHIVKLVCISEDAAKMVVKELDRPDDDLHWLREGGHNIVAIGYINPRWPMDVAEWAHSNEYAHDDDASRTIVEAQKNLGLL